jgi:hypothetical protein
VSLSFARFRSPPEVVLLAVRWYLRYGLSYRDVEELLAERGAEVDHVTMYRWVQRFTPLAIDAARPSRHSVADRSFSMKPSSRWPVHGGTCTALWTSTARSSTYYELGVEARHERLRVAAAFDELTATI